jgi:hypothetical protein
MSAGNLLLALPDLVDRKTPHRKCPSCTAATVPEVRTLIYVIFMKTLSNYK